MRHHLRDSMLERVYERVEQKANETLLAIASKDHQDSGFYKLRGYRDACNHLMELLIEIDKEKDSD